MGIFQDDAWCFVGGRPSATAAISIKETSPGPRRRRTGLVCATRGTLAMGGRFTLTKLARFLRTHRDAIGREPGRVRTAWIGEKTTIGTARETRVGKHVQPHQPQTSKTHNPTGPQVKFALFILHSGNGQGGKISSFFDILAMASGCFVLFSFCFISFQDKKESDSG